MSIKIILLSFSVLLILVSLRAEDLFFEHFGSESMKAYVLEKYQKQRGNAPTVLEYAVLIYVVGKFLVSFTSQKLQIMQYRTIRT